MKDLAIVIVNWNTKALLKQCLESVYAETKSDSFAVWVVDNNSPDGSAEMIKNMFPKVNLIANKENRGFAAANNQALKLAEARYYLLLNPDTLIINNAVDKLLAKMKEENLHAATCRLLNQDLSLQESVQPFFSLYNSVIRNRFTASFINGRLAKAGMNNNSWNHDTFSKIDWAHGAVLAFSEEVKSKVGILDEQFYIYGEEIDFYLRLREAGYSAWFIPDISIIHYGKASSNQRKAEMFIQNYKSFYLLLKKHYPRYVYLLYRLRVYFYLPAWIIFYFIKATHGQGREMAVNQLGVYTGTFKWHFSGKSKIKLNLV